MSEDPRATQVYNNSNEDQNISEVLTKLQKSTQVNAFFVLSNYLDCPDIKNQPQFFEILFQKNMDTVLELIEWMFIPKELIKRKKIKTNVDSYPYQCRELLKDNWCFYERIYIACRNKKMELSDLFKFLRKDFYQKSTIVTALGYFSDVMVPFAKHEFSLSYDVKKALDKVNAAQHVETYSLLKVVSEELIKELISYSHHEAVFQFVKTLILTNVSDPTQCTLSKKIFVQLISFWQVPNICSKFTVPSMYVQQCSKYIDFYEALCHSIREIQQNIEQTSLNNNSKQIWSPTYPTFCLLQYIVESKLVQYLVKQLIQSKLCGGNLLKDKQRLYNSSDGEVDKNKSSLKQINQRETTLSLSAQFSSSIMSSMNLSDDPQEQQLDEIFLKTLEPLIEIFSMLPKYAIFKQEEVKTSETKAEQTEISMDDVLSQSLLQAPKNVTKKSKKQVLIQVIDPKQYSLFVTQFHHQIQYLLSNLQNLTKFLYIPPINLQNSITLPTPTTPSSPISTPISNSISLNTQQNFTVSASTANTNTNNTNNFNSKVLPFASGQNVRAVSFMKYKCIRLVYTCLKLVNKDTTTQAMISSSTMIEKRQGGQNSNSNKINIKNDITKIRVEHIDLPYFELNIQKLYIIQIVKKYLSENKWNNITQSVLIRICHTLIMNNYDYIKKNIEKDKNKKFSDSFLAYLIQNFTKRDFVFLNTVKFTTQGNLYALYKITKDLAYSLNSTNELVLFLNQFQPWKKFILNDLKNYEQKLFPKCTMPQSQQNEQNQVKLKVDEADSIKKLIDNISNSKWPNKQLGAKSLSKNTQIPFRNSFDSAKPKQKDAMKLSHHKQKQKMEDQPLKSVKSQEPGVFLQQKQEQMAKVQEKSTKEENKSSNYNKKMSMIIDRPKDYDKDSERKS